MPKLFSYLIAAAVLLLLIMGSADFIMTGKFDPVGLALSIGALLLCQALYRLVCRPPKAQRRR